MKNLTLEHIADCCHGTYIGIEEQQGFEVTGVVIDSRKVEAGNLFVAIKGERVDGHTFIDAVYERLENPKGPYILVDSTTQALKDIAAFYRNSLDIKVVGIT